MLDWVVQRLDELEERRIQRGEKLCRLQQETTCGSAMRFQLSSKGRDVKSIEDHSPVGVGPVVIPQIIEVDNQSDLLDIQHPPNSLAVVVIRLGLNKRPSVDFSHSALRPQDSLGDASPLQKGRRSWNGMATHVVVEKLDELACTIPHEVVREHGPGILCG